MAWWSLKIWIEELQTNRLIWGGSQGGCRRQQCSNPIVSTAPQGGDWISVQSFSSDRRHVVIHVRHERSTRHSRRLGTCVIHIRGRAFVYSRRLQTEAAEAAGPSARRLTLHRHSLMDSISTTRSTALGGSFRTPPVHSASRVGYSRLRTWLNIG